ncbi:hypothetical protein BHE74_00012352 [Ensete ventricosum]|nr:hypothetical protein BHE74_00012352 [Ensete ventricosum]
MGGRRDRCSSCCCFNDRTLVISKVVAKQQRGKVVVGFIKVEEISVAKAIDNSDNVRGIYGFAEGDGP